ncbi:MAG: DUF473 family protein [archaeon]
MKTLIGILDESMRDLKENEIKTLELVTPDNVTTAENLERKEEVFITSAGKRDAKPGTKGIIAEVKHKKRFYNKIGSLFDEKEALTVRIQLEYLEEAEAKDVMIEDRGLETEIEKHFLFG